MIYCFIPGNKNGGPHFESLCNFVDAKAKAVLLSKELEMAVHLTHYMGSTTDEGFMSAADMTIAASRRAVPASSIGGSR